MRAAWEARGAGCGERGGSVGGAGCGWGARGATVPMEFTAGGVMDGTAEEHVGEAARVLSSYVDLIAIRCFPECRDWAVERGLATGLSCKRGVGELQHAHEPILTPKGHIQLPAFTEKL